MSAFSPLPKEAFDALFSGVAGNERATLFKRYTGLINCYTQIDQEIAAIDKKWSLPEAGAGLEKAGKALQLDKKYRVVLVGTMGAGKSMLLNALLGRKLVPSAAGGTITDFSLRIHFDNNPAGKEMVRVIMPENYARTPAAQDFIKQIQTQAQKHAIAFEEKTTTAETLPEGQYFLKPQLPNFDEVLLKALPHVVLIDTPGAGATNKNHIISLKREVDLADAIVFMVSAERPDFSIQELEDLLNESFFKGLTPEEKNRLAEKTFLIANKYDLASQATDKERLRENMKKISVLLAPNFMQEHGEGSPRQRYFKIVAQQALFACLKQQGKTLEQENESWYIGRVDLVQKQSDKGQDFNQHQELWNKSDVPAFFQKLNEFLGDSRAGRELDEAKHQLKLALQAARRKCKEVIKENFGEQALEREITGLDGKLQASRLCFKKLDEDVRELGEKYKGMQLELYQWEKKPQNIKNQERLLKEIYAILQKRVNEHLNNSLAQGSDHRANYISETLYDMGKRRDETIDVRKILIESHQQLQLAIEEEARERLAAWFDEIFDQHLTAHQIYETLKKKTYRQPYAQGLVADLENQQKDFEQKMKDICCWVLLAETANRLAPEAFGLPENAREPVWLPSGQAEQKTSFAGWAIDAIPRALDGSWAPEEFAAKVIVKVGAEAIKQVIAAKEASTQHLAIQLLEGKYQKIVNTFGQMTQAIFEQALPIISTLFFYETAKYRTLYYQKTKELCNFHKANVNDEQVQRALLGNNVDLINNTTLAQEFLAKIEGLEKCLREEYA